MSGAYKNSEYFIDLAQQDQKRKAKERLEALLLEGIDSQGQEATPPLLARFAFYGAMFLGVS